MKLYRTAAGPVLETDARYFALDEDWDSLINDDQLRAKLEKLAKTARELPGAAPPAAVLAPIGRQELWATGVTYFRSKQGRQEESKNAGGGDFYQRVYEAERPEVFFKAPGWRVRASGQKVRIRRDSTWDAPEPELTLFITSGRKIVGYTIGNDMSSRSIEGENPLYLPQAKNYDGAAALGPCLYVPDAPLPPETTISLQVLRDAKTAYGGEVHIDQIKRKFEDLAEFLFREMAFPDGAFLMTGTGIVPGSDFTLEAGDLIRIEIPPIGVLENTVAAPGELGA